MHGGAVLAGRKQKKRSASVPNTTCSAQLSLSAPTNISAVKRPHAARIAANPSWKEAPVLSAPLSARMCQKANPNQKAPYAVNAVAPKVLFLANSHMPAISWQRPPKKIP